MRIVIFLLLMTAAFVSNAQDIRTISGKVVDSRTKEPLAFVNIIINNSFYGGTSDIDGKFRLRSSQTPKTLKLSYVGYEPLVYTLGSRTEGLQISMTRKEIELSEVEILPGINPAHRIIRNCIDNRELNDPEKLYSFSYTMYEKTIFTLDVDTSVSTAFVDTASLRRMQNSGIQFTINEDAAGDTIIADSAAMDSASRMIEKLISEQYLFLMENVTKRKFLHPDRNYNEVIATKMSGFKDPIFVFLSTQIQSFSFYKPFITIFQKSYVNPIGGGSISRYFYKIEDTTYHDQDTTFIISFRPRKGTNFDGLSGIISISSHKWAIQNVIAEPYPNDAGFRIKIQQMYELIDGDHWFPVQLNTDVAFDNLQVGRYKAIGSGRSYIRDIVLNPELVRREFSHLDIEVTPAATSRPDQFWNQYRMDTLTSRDRKTYQVLDSIGKANNFDKLAKSAQTLLTGKIPWGPIDIDINRFINYSSYEGLVLGAGLHTNDKLSRWFRVGGFYQYAFAANFHKFGGDFRFLVSRRNDVAIQLEYFQDLLEAGGVTYPGHQQSILSGNFRPLLIRKQDKTERFAIGLSFRALKYVVFHAGINRDFKKSTTTDWTVYDGNVTILDDEYFFTEVRAGFKWAYGEKFVQTINNKISLGTRYPTVWLQYTRGINGFLGGEFDYNRIDFKLEKTFQIKFLGKLTMVVKSGIVDRPIPATNLYYGEASYRLITLWAPQSFATMRMNEFLSDRYASLYLYHDFGDLLFKGKKWFHPQFALSQNIGFGWLDHEDHYINNGVAWKKMDLGYYESGLLINNLVDLKVYNIGVGAYYRWGPYTFPYAADNFSYKISVIFPL